MKNNQPEQKGLLCRISTSNSKLGAHIPTLNQPAIITCNRSAPCAKCGGCYACKGPMAFANVKSAYIFNMQSYLRDAEAFFNAIDEYLNSGLVIYKFFRWHSAGDIIDALYFEKMVELAKKTPYTKFLAFTKKFDIVNDFLNGGGTIPKNLSIVFSAWGDGFQPENPHGLPVAHIRLKNERVTTIPHTAQECGGDCSQCQKCWHLKNGEAVVFNQH